MGLDIAPYGEAIAKGSELLNGILKRVLPEKIDETTAAKLEQELTLALLRGELDPMLAQLKVNEEEAKHESIWVAGWRPFIGWVCGSAFAYRFIVQPFLVFFLTVLKVDVGPLPVLDYGELSAVLLGMLGLGGLRTFEKVKGVSGTPVGR